MIVWGKSKTHWKSQWVFINILNAKADVLMARAGVLNCLRCLNGFFVSKNFRAPV